MPAKDDPPAQRAYNGGLAARMDGRDKSACPHGTTALRLRHWWLAGWHDADMDAQSASTSTSPATPVRPVTRRKAAIHAGRKTYIGQCAKHGETERYTVNRACVLCQKLREGARHGQ